MAKRGRKPKLKISDLIAAGWIDRQAELTNEERDWQANGRPVEGKPNARQPAPDWFYYYRVIDGIEVRIYAVGKDFYWNGGKVKYAHQLEIIETKGVEHEKWKAVIAELPPTEPLKSAEKTGVRQGKAPNIRLKGGPLDGNKRLWNTMFHLFAEQCYIDDSQTGTVLHRYKRDTEDKTLYHYMDTQ
jgi:hypothetical protein